MEGSQDVRTGSTTEVRGAVPCQPLTLSNACSLSNALFKAVQQLPVFPCDELELEVGVGAVRYLRPEQNLVSFRFASVSVKRTGSSSMNCSSMKVTWNMVTRKGGSGVLPLHTLSARSQEW